MKTYLQGKTYVTGKLLIAKVRTQDFLKSLVTKENGDTNFVSIILIIVIVLAIAALFKDALIELANTVIQQLTDFVGGGEAGAAGGAGE